MKTPTGFVFIENPHPNGKRSTTLKCAEGYVQRGWAEWTDPQHIRFIECEARNRAQMTSPQPHIEGCGKSAPSMRISNYERISLSPPILGGVIAGLDRRVSHFKKPPQRWDGEGHPIKLREKLATEGFCNKRGVWVAKRPGAAGLLMRPDPTEQEREAAFNRYMEPSPDGRGFVVRPEKVGVGVKNQ